METSVRRQVRERARHRCEYCGLAERDVYIPHHIDHIRPKQHGGDDSPNNLSLCCQGCNLKKGPNLAGIDAETGALVALFNPREQVWAEHFVLEGTIIRGLTPPGRVTVQVLDMNSRERVKTREDLQDTDGLTMRMKSEITQSSRVAEASYLEAIDIAIKQRATGSI